MSDSASFHDQVSAALTAVTDCIDFMRARIGAPTDEEIPCVELCTDPQRLAALVHSTADGRQLTDPVVAASVLSLSYAYRVAGTTLAIGFLTGTWCDPAAENMAIGISRDRPARVVFRTPTVVEPAAATQRLFEQHLDPFCDSMRQAIRIGNRLLLGNISAGIVSAARAVCGVATDPDAMWVTVREWFATAPHDLERFGVPIGPDYRRTTCCLWWKTTDSGGYCGDCSLTADTHESKLAATKGSP